MNYMYIGFDHELFTTALFGSVSFEVHVRSNTEKHVGRETAHYDYYGSGDYLNPASDYGQFGHYFARTYANGQLFEPLLPSNVNLTDGDNYADLQLYNHEFFFSFYHPAVIDFFADVTDGDRPMFNYTDQSPEPGFGWSDSYYFSTYTFVQGSAYRRMDPIDLAFPITEVLALDGWQSGNGLRVRGIPNAANQPNHVQWPAHTNSARSKEGVLNVAYKYAPAFSLQTMKAYVLNVIRSL